MAAAGNAPAVSNKDQESAKASFMGIPLTRWAIVAVSAIVVIYTAIHFGVKAYIEAVQLHEGESAYSQAVTREMEVHKTDNSGHQTVIHEDQGKQILATYFSDGCIAIQRPGEPLPYLSQPEAHVEWSLSPSRRPPAKAPTKLAASPLWGLVFGGATPHHVPSTDLQGRAAGDPILMADIISMPFGDKTLQPVQAGCLNPHPWGFQGSWGQANGCWVPFWRRWTDGCTHYQMYNTCSGQWDPQINWTFCSGMHHP